jgi:hypothetical protein
LYSFVQVCKQLSGLTVSLSPVPCCILQEILEVEQVTEESQGLSLTAENVDQVGANASQVAVGSQQAAQQQPAVSVAEQ